MHIHFNKPKERLVWFVCNSLNKTVPNGAFLAETYSRVWHCAESRQTGFKYSGGRERLSFFTGRETVM